MTPDEIDLLVNSVALIVHHGGAFMKTHGETHDELYALLEKRIRDAEQAAERRGRFNGEEPANAVQTVRRYSRWDGVTAQPWTHEDVLAAARRGAQEALYFIADCFVIGGEGDAEKWARDVLAKMYPGGGGDAKEGR